MIASVPLKIARKGEDVLSVMWNDKVQTDYQVYDLRLHCPCAKCIDEWTGKPLLNPSDVPGHIHPTRIFSVGRYAMGIHFSDGHQSGIYTYDYLKRLKTSSSTTEK